MKVIHVLRRFSRQKWGGVEEYVSTLVKKQCELGVASQVIASSALIDKKNDEAEAPVHYFAYRYPYLSLSSGQRSALDDFGGDPFSFGMRKFLEREKPDVLHLHTTARLVLPLVKWANEQAQSKVVLSLHSGLAGEKSVRAPAVSRKNLPYGFLFDRYYQRKTLFQRVDVFHCMNEQDREQLTESGYGNKARCIEPFFNPLFTTEFEESATSVRERFGLSVQHPVFIIVGRIHPLKNQLAAIHAMPYLEGAQLIIVGPTVDRSYREEIDSFIKKNHLEERVKILGAFDPADNDRVKLLRAADFLLFPSLLDSFGLVVIEAWAAKCAVISSPLEQWRTANREKKVIFIADFSDPKSLAGSLGKLLKLPISEKMTLIENAQYRALERYGTEQHLRQILSLYTS